MAESRLTYDQFKADILQWKNSHREEYNRFARLMTNGDERQYLAICRAIFKQLPKVKAEWELCWGDDSVEDFDNISLMFSEESVPEQIVEAFQKQREENNSSDRASYSVWDKVKSFFRSKSKRHGIILSAPLVLSWLYYGKSFEAMVSMVSKQSANPKADRMDRQSCSWVAERIIQVSIKNGFRTQADWDRYFSMNRAIESGTIDEWALREVREENATESTQEHSKKRTPDDTTASTLEPSFTGGRPKAKNFPLSSYIDCQNKDVVIGALRKYLIGQHTANGQALSYYALTQLELLTVKSDKEFSVGVVKEFGDIPTLKSESAIRQAISQLRREQYITVNQKMRSGRLLDSDEFAPVLLQLKSDIIFLTTNNN